MSEVYFNHTTKQIPVKMGLAPAASIAIKKEGDFFVYGITICSKYDSFSKKEGRERALGRLNEGFRKTAIPTELVKFGQENGEKRMILTFLYQLSASVSANSRKWKKKITRFNIANKGLAKVVSMNYPDHSSNQTPAA